MDINLHNIAYPVQTLGPGQRIVIWVAGCRRRCPGCITPELQDDSAGCPVPPAVLANRLFHIQGNIQGITVSGGEPAEQIPALTCLFTLVRKQRPDWDILVYSGYLLAEIKKMSAGCHKFLSCIDYLIDGPFQQDNPACDGLRGSANQQIHCLSDRARRRPLPGGEQRYRQRELGLGRKGFAMLIGIPGQGTKDQHNEPQGR